MPPDVLIKCIANNSFQNGSAVTNVLPGGGYDALRPTINQIPSSGAVFDEYDGKFDDKTYYTT